MMENLKSVKRILSSPVSCTFGESSVNGRLMFLQLVILTNEAFDKCE